MTYYDKSNKSQFRRIAPILSFTYKILYYDGCIVSNVHYADIDYLQLGTCIMTEYHFDVHGYFSVLM